jgi:RimJ/RimL family protein N-acetyltransferase
MARRTKKRTRRGDRGSIRFTVRRARPSDREGILEMSTHIWGGNDYMPLVWDRWLEDKAGVLLTAAANGLPVGTAKVSVLSPGEVWLEGLRLHPDYQGMGLSKRIHQATFREASTLNPRSIRYSTWIGNEASRRIAEKNDFWQIARTGWMWGRARPDWRMRSRQATMADARDTIEFIENSECYAATNGVAGVGWTFPELRRNRIRSLISRGQVRIYPRRGKPRAVAAWDVGKVDNDICLGFIDGSDEDVTRLARDVLRIASDTGRGEASAMVPIGRLADTVEAAGFDEWRPVQAVVYEKGARGLDSGDESLEGVLQRTLRANESEVLDTVAQLLADRAPAPLARENVRDYISRHLIPDTDRLLIAATQPFVEALSNEILRTILRGVIEHLHYEHGLAGDAISATTRVINVRHIGRKLAVLRARVDAIELTLGPGFGHCFAEGARFRVGEVRFPDAERPRAGRYESVTLVLKDRRHIEGERKAIDTIMKCAARNGGTGR